MPATATPTTATQRKALEQRQAATTRKALADRRKFLHRMRNKVHQYTGIDMRDQELVRLERENRDVKRALDALYRQEGQASAATKSKVATKRRKRTRGRRRGRSSGSKTTSSRKQLVLGLVLAVAGALVVVKRGTIRNKWREWLNQHSNSHKASISSSHVRSPASAPASASASASAPAPTSAPAPASAPAPRTIKIVPSKFTRHHTQGDFKWEIEQDTEPHTLYVFNDNEEDHYNCFAGGGNAVIRQYNAHSEKQPIRSAGICTGNNGNGYRELTVRVKAIIDRDVQEIRDLLATGHYVRIKYSSDGQNGLGTGIFTVGEDVKAYIVQQINSLAVP